MTPGRSDHADEAARSTARRIGRRDLRFITAARDEDVALLDACPTIEGAYRLERFATPERLLSHCQLEDGDRDSRLLDLPTAPAPAPQQT